MDITDHVKAAFVLLVSIGLLGLFVNHVPPRIGSMIFGALTLAGLYYVILFFIRMPRP